MVGSHLENCSCEMCIKMDFQRLQAENKALRELLKRVDCEFDDLSKLDCPQYVVPNEKLWSEINDLLTQTPTEPTPKED